MKAIFERVTVCLLGVLLLASIAWARKYALTTSTIVPAAKGEISTEIDKNGNTAVHLTVEHLAEPSKLSPPGTTYIIWFQQQGEQPQNEGESKIGQNLKGEFKGVMPWKTFQLFGMAESNALATGPSGEQVFRATVQP